MEHFNKTILITGCSGLLGWNLSTHLKKRGFEKIIGVFNGNPQSPEGIVPIQTDLTNKKTVSQELEKFSPDIIIHCAALTNVDLCEKDPNLAFLVNRDICKNLREAFPKTKIIYISTDQLWDGSKQFCEEEEPVNPLNVYGQSKYEGELEILKHSNVLILRTNFFGGDLSWRQSFTGWVNHLLSEKKKITAFKDIFFTPLAMPYLVCLITDSLLNNLEGTFHLVGKERVSKYDVAFAFAQNTGLDTSFIIKASSADSTQFIAKRPKEMSLSSTKLSRALGKNMPTLIESITSINRPIYKTG